MPKTYTFTDVESMLRALKGNNKKLKERLEKAINNTVRKGVQVIKSRVPVASGELRDSIHVQLAGKLRTIVADAPHAWPVENGSVPHMPPVEPLIKWCILRGIPEPEKVAWAIAMKIKEEGTKPAHYMRGSIPEIQRILSQEVRKAMGR